MFLQDSQSDSDGKVDPEEEEQRRKFEAKRKAHYNEYMAVQRMREHHSSDDEDDDDDDDGLSVDPVAARNAKLNAGIPAEPPEDDQL